jgi:hypothetical protein
MLIDNFSPAELRQAESKLADVGVRSGLGDVASMLVMLGFLMSVIRIALFAHPDDVQLRAAAAAGAVFRGLPRGTDMSDAPRPRGTEQPAPPVPDLDATQEIQIPVRSLPTPEDPVCMVDPGTLFCRTHQGMHVITRTPTLAQLQQIITGLKELV